MTVKELSRDQMTELKQHYLFYVNVNTSWGELADADKIVSDEKMFEEYAEVCFVNDDFACTAGL